MLEQREQLSPADRLQADGPLQSLKLDGWQVPLFFTRPVFVLSRCTRCGSERVQRV